MDIVKYGDPVLRARGQRIETITDELRSLAEAMIETMRAANGVGLAAQQVGHALQMAVVDVTGADDEASAMIIDGKEADLAEWSPMVLLNPELDFGPGKESAKEGCLSFPGLTGSVTRPSEVSVKAQLIDGRHVEFHAKGLFARAIQHEVDHLNGILFIDRMNSTTKAIIAGKLKKMQKEA